MLVKPIVTWRRRPGRPRHTWLRTLNALQTSIRSITDSTQHGDLQRTENDGGNSWKRLRSSLAGSLVMLMMMMMIVPCTG